MRLKDSIAAAAVLAAGLVLNGCGEKAVKADPAAEAPPKTEVITTGDPAIVKVDHPEQFQVVPAGSVTSGKDLNVTGTVTPDVSRAVPVISLASGRVIEIHAKLGDMVTKGQLLLRVQSADISGAYSDYRQAVADLTLAKAQLERSKILYDKGALAQKDLEVAVDTEAKAQVTLETTAEKLKLLGVGTNNPSSIVDITAPITGVITDQQVTQAAGVQALATPNPFTISDLSSVWIVCDVFENDLAAVRIGENAEVRLNAYPDKTFPARIDNIGPVLDPNLRTAKVRLEVKNPGQMRLGMFVTATFHSAEKQTYATVPASAVLHLHDREWVYLTAENNSFRRVEVKGGKILPGNLQEVLSGIQPGDRVVRDALVLQNTVEQ